MSIEAKIGNFKRYVLCQKACLKNQLNDYEEGSATHAYIMGSLCELEQAELFLNEIYL
jgi:hypothetical protein